MNELYDKINTAAEGKYHSIFLGFGEQQGKNGNFHCWNSHAHKDGVDTEASLSVENKTGRWICHACAASGNLARYFKTQVAFGPKDNWNGSFVRFMCDRLGIDSKGNAPADLQLLEEAELLLQAYQKESIISKEQNDGYVSALLSMEKAKKYLMDYRHIDEATIKKYDIGFDEQDKCFTFPMKDNDGDIVNIKMYRPWNRDRKWQLMIKGNPTPPGPACHLSENKLYIYEGEPDCYCGAAHGLLGITAGTASNKSYKKLYGTQFETLFKGKEIVLVMDADDKGVTAARTLAVEFAGVASQVKIIDLNKSAINPHGLDPNLMKDVNGKQKRAEKDFSEFMRKNGFELQIFRELEEKTAPERNSVIELATEAGGDADVQMSAADIATLFVTSEKLVFGRTHHLRHWRGSFWKWRTSHYEKLEDSDFRAMVTRFMQLDAGARQYTSSGTISSVIDNIAGMVHINDSIDQPAWIDGIERKGNFFSMKNGILDINSLINGESFDKIILSHHHSFFTAVSVDYDYKPDATCPQFLKFLDTILPCSKTQSVLQEWTGYLFDSTTRFETFWMGKGEGSNGKGVYVDVTTALIGERNTSAVSLEQFCETHALITTLGKVANIVTEIGDVDKAAEGILKAFVSQNPINFNPKFKPAFQARPTAKLMFSTNNLPRITDKTNGVWRRLLLFPFNVEIAKEERDLHYAEKIIATELSGVFNWAIAGLKRLLSRGYFETSEIMNSATQEYQADNNSSKVFLMEECIERAGSEEKFSFLYKCYSEYCKMNGKQPVNSSQFSKEIRRVYPRSRIERKREGEFRERYCFGIKHGEVFSSDPDTFIRTD